MLNFQLFRGLYAGSTPALVANVSENSCLFAARGLTQVSERALTQVSGIGKGADSGVSSFDRNSLNYRASLEVRMKSKHFSGCGCSALWRRES